jgi:predicted NUDIX family NTP pyrophosphohydrolase
VAKKTSSAGLLMYRRKNGLLEVLLVHLGGPFWKKDVGSWFVPKGEINPGEETLAAARREFQEETGIVPQGEFLQLGEVKHKSGKQVFAWAFEGDCDPGMCKSNTFEMEWPPKSGKTAKFPEIDRAEFFSVEQASRKMHPAEFEFLGRLQRTLRGPEER